MRLFNCKVRLAGSLLNEVRKKDVTAAEITVLRVLHNPRDGEDMVSDIKPTGKEAFDEVADAEGETRKILRNDRMERERLNALYGDALRTIEDVKNLNGVFGVAGRLPETVDGVVNEPVTNPEAQIARSKVVTKDTDVPQTLADLE